MKVATAREKRQVEVGGGHARDGTGVRQDVALRRGVRKQDGDAVESCCAVARARYRTLAALQATEA